MLRELTPLMLAVVVLVEITTAHGTLTPQAAETARRNWQLGPDPSHCAIIFHRHVHKMAGSSIRESFLELRARTGYFYWGYWQKKDEWDAMIAALNEVEVDTVPLPRLYVEIHAEAASQIFISHFLPDILALRSTYKAKGIDCPVILFTLTRNPVDFYYSYFEWRGLPKLQAEDPEKYGSSFQEWMPSNLESRLFYYAKISWNSIEGIQKDEKERPMDPQILNELKSMLLNDFDIVGTVERFNESVSLLSEMAGIPSVYWRKVTPRAKDYVKKSSFCPDLRICDNWIIQHAQYDIEFFQELNNSFAEKIAAKASHDKVVPSDQEVGSEWIKKLSPCKKAKQAVKDGFDAWEISCDALSLPFNVLQVYYTYRDFERPYIYV